MGTKTIPQNFVHLNIHPEQHMRLVQWQNELMDCSPRRKGVILRQIGSRIENRISSGKMEHPYTSALMDMLSRFSE